MLKTTTDCSYTDTMAEGGKVYQYKVRCYWTIGECLLRNIFLSGFSDYLAGKGCWNRNTDADRDFAWVVLGRNTGAVGYQIYQYSAASSQYEMAADVGDGSTSYTISGLTGANEYKFKIRAYEKIMIMYFRAGFRMFTVM